MKITILALALVANCATARTDYTTPEPIAPPVDASATGERHRIVVLPFRNSANITEFSLIADGDYTEHTYSNVSNNPNLTLDTRQPNPATHGSPTESGEAQIGERESEDGNDGTSSEDEELANANQDGEPDSSEETDDSEGGETNPTDPEPASMTGEGEIEVEGTESQPDKVDGEEDNAEQSDEATGDEEPPAVDPAAVAREVTESALFESGRFEIIPLHVMNESVAAYEADGFDRAEALSRAATDLKLDYVVLGDLTNFELRQETSYWKVPFWAIVLVGSFFIENDELRLWIWYALLRALAAIPLDSAFWKAGFGYEDLELIVDVGMDLRLVDPVGGSVIYSDSADIARLESVRNLDLFVWATTNSVRITRSSAGRQIRFASHELVNRLSNYLDRAPEPNAQPETVETTAAQR